MTVKDTLRSILLKTVPITGTHVSHRSGHPLRQSWESCFVRDSGHSSLLGRQFLSNENMTVCPHPPYSPALAPCDLWLFLKVKMTVKQERSDRFGTSRQPGQRHWRQSPRRTSKAASEGGRTPGHVCSKSGGLCCRVAMFLSLSYILSKPSPYFLITPHAIHLSWAITSETSEKTVDFVKAPSMDFHL